MLPATSTSEPPVLELSALNGIEDSPIIIYISAHAVVESGANSSELSIRIIKFPPGSTFNRGTPNGQIWVLNATDFGEFELHLPEHSSGRFEITAEALETDGNDFHGRMGTVQFTVKAVADVPSLDITHSPCIDSGSFMFMINSELVDSDGSEILLVTISDLPTGSILSAGQVNEEGDYILGSEELQRDITATIPPTSTDIVKIAFTATASEIFNNSTASTNMTVSLNKCPEGISITYNLFYC